MANRGESAETTACVSSPWDLNKNCPAKSRMFGAVLGGSPEAQHKFAYLTPVGKILSARLEDPRIQKISKEDLGLPTPGVNIRNPISWDVGTTPAGAKPDFETTKELLRQLNEALGKK